MQVRPRSRSYMRVLALVAVIATTASCGGDGSTDPGSTVAQITLAPLAPTVVAGQTVTLSAQPKDVSGNVVTGQGVAWATSDATIATVSGGVVTAIKPGSATVSATSGSATANTTVTVIAAIDRVVVTPSPADVIVNSTVQLTATLRDAAGAEIPARNIVWSSSSDAAATVSSTGLVTGKVVGAVTITATAEGKVGSTTVNVRPVPVATVTITPNPLNLVLGSNGQLTATTSDAAGNSLGRAVTWSSSNESIATVGATTGAVTSKGVGTATITATSEGRTGTSSVVVRNPTVSSVTITPASPTVEAGTTTTLTAEVRDENGVLLTGQSIQWTTTDGSKVAVSTSGVVTGVAVGSATVTATSGGKSGSTTVSVADTKAPTLLGLTLTPSTVNVRTAPAQVTVSAQLSDGSGITQFDVQLTPPSADAAKVLTCTSTTPTSGSPTNGTFSCTLTIPQGAEAGTWTLLIGALAKAGPSFVANSTTLSNMGITPSRVTVQ